MKVLKCLVPESKNFDIVIAHTVITNINQIMFTAPQWQNSVKLTIASIRRYRKCRIRHQFYTNQPKIEHFEFLPLEGVLCN